MQLSRPVIWSLSRFILDGVAKHVLPKGQSTVQIPDNLPLFTNSLSS